MKHIYKYSVIIFLFILFTPKVYGASATLSLSPSYGTYTAGDVFDLEVNLNTGGGKTVGTDVIVNYDPVLLKMTDIVIGSIYTQYVGKEIDNTTGKATISGISNELEKAFTGTGTFATLKFQGLKTGTGTISFAYTQGSRNDSNVMDYDTQTDILTAATGGTYNLVAGGSASATPTPITDDNTDNTIPESGVSFPTISLTVFGLMTIILGTFYFRKSI